MKLVAAAVIISKGRVLLARRKPGESHQGFWEFPGGAVEPGETLEECLARELREELGLPATVGDVIAENEDHSGGGSLKLVALRAHIEEGEFALAAHDKVEWVRPRELNRYRLAPADVPIAETLKKRTDLFRK